MSISTPFIERPVATTLLTVAIVLAGGIAYKLLPVAPLPQIDYPTINVTAGLPGGSPEVMAASVATPLSFALRAKATVFSCSRCRRLAVVAIKALFCGTR